MSTPFHSPLPAHPHHSGFFGTHFGVDASPSTEHHPGVVHDSYRHPGFYATDVVVASANVADTPWNVPGPSHHALYTPDGAISVARQQDLPAQAYADHEASPVSGSGPWAYQDYVHSTQAEPSWMFSHAASDPEVDRAHFEDAQGLSYPDGHHHYTDSYPDNTGSISPLSDSSQGYMTVHYSIPHSSVSSIANWNVYPHEHQHRSQSGANPSSPTSLRETLADVSRGSATPEDVPRHICDADLCHSQNHDHPACVEHRRSRHRDTQPLLVRQRQHHHGDQSETSHPDPYLTHDRQSYSPGQESPQPPSNPLYPSPHYVPSQRPRRPPSPMAHLPYPEEAQRDRVPSPPYTTPTAEHVPGWPEHSRHGHPPVSTQGRAERHLHRPRVRYLIENSHPSFPLPGPSSEPHTTSRSAPPVPTRIALPPPPRSPPLIEDPPKKALTLACLFCRKRKIACGSPPVGSPNRTCNQCARRNLKCVFPTVSRRGMRPKPRESEPTSIDGVFHMEVVTQ